MWANKSMSQPSTSLVSNTRWIKHAFSFAQLKKKILFTKLFLFAKKESESGNSVLHRPLILLKEHQGTVLAIITDISDFTVLVKHTTHI